MKLFKYLGKYWYAILAALVLLGIQAHSDLTLPSITSDIVDVGIQQGGLENPTPETIRKSTLSAVELFMTDAEKDTIKENYKAGTKTVDGKKVEVYNLNLQKGMTKEKLAKIFELPMMMLASSKEKDSKDGNAAKEILDTYQKLGTDGKKAQELGAQAKSLGEQAQTAATEAQTAAAAGDMATAQTKGAQAQQLADEAKEKGAQAQKIGDELQKTNDAMPEKVAAARKETKAELGDMGEDSMKTVGVQLTLAE